MKRFIICLALLTFTFCSSEDCLKESSTDSCKSIAVEDFDGFSCFASVSGCIIFPKDTDIQKAFIKLNKGFSLEYFSAVEGYPIDFMKIPSFNKESYTEDEMIVRNEASLTDEQKNVMKSNNTCYYNFINRFNESENKYNNVEDKNICYKASKFSELDGLVDCGYIDFKFKTLGNKDVSIKTCFPTPNENMPEELKQYFKEIVLETYYIERLLEIKETMEDDTDSYEIVVENSNGNKVLYTDESDVPIPILIKNSRDYDEKATKLVNSFWDTLYEVGQQLSSFIGSINKKIINIIF